MAPVWGLANGIDTNSTAAFTWPLVVLIDCAASGGPDAIRLSEGVRVGDKLQPYRWQAETAMKQVGRRRMPVLSEETNGDGLASTMAFSAELTRLAGGRVAFPKGIFRYRSHEEANEHQARCLAEGMAQLARERKNG